MKVMVSMMRRGMCFPFMSGNGRSDSESVISTYLCGPETKASLLQC
jgi:hypothetical protein